MNRPRIWIVVYLAHLWLAFGSSAVRAQRADVATDWKEIQAPALHAFHPQPPKRIQLSNGMVIFLQEDHELPFIRGTARIRGGSPRNRRRRPGWYESMVRCGAQAELRARRATKWTITWRCARRQGRNVRCS